MAVTATAMGLVFVTVTDCAALVELISRLPKASDRGASVSTDPVPWFAAVAKGEPAIALKAPVELLMV